MLSEADRELLVFEQKWWKHRGAKDAAIRQQFGISPTRYYQRLRALADSPDVLAEFPMWVNRMRRGRAS